MEDTTFTWKLAGQHPGPMWDPANWDGQRHELLSAADDTPGSSTRHGTTPSPARAPGSTPRWPTAGWTSSSKTATTDGNHASLRRLLFDLIEEYGRHTGHADLLREVVDGRVGEDPPNDWRPVSGAPLTWIRRTAGLVRRREHAPAQRAHARAQLGAAEHPEATGIDREPLRVPGRVARRAHQPGRRAVHRLDPAQVPRQPRCARCARRLEEHVDLVLPADGQVRLELGHRVEVLGRRERLVEQLDALDPVHAVRAAGVRRRRVAQQVPAAVPHDDRPRVHHGLPRVATLRPVRHADAPVRRAGLHERRRRRRVGPGGGAVGAGAVVCRTACTGPATAAGNDRTILPSAVPTGCSGSSASWCPSSTAMTSANASAAVSIRGGGRSPRPIRYPPYGPRTDSIGISASRRVATYRRAARSETPSLSASRSAVMPGLAWMQLERQQRAGGRVLVAAHATPLVPG